MNTLVWVLTGLLLVLAITSPPCAKSDTLTSKHEFTSIVGAVKNAVARYNGQSIENDVEYIGGVLRDEYGRHYYSVSKGNEREAHADAHIQVPKGHAIVALWHTHGGERWDSKYFSAFDTALAEHLRVPIYMINSTWVLKVFNPGDNTLTPASARRLGLGATAGIAKGKTVH